MSQAEDNLVVRIHRLATALSQGTLSEDQRAELTQLLSTSAEAQRTYLEYTQDTVSLRWISSGHYEHRVSLPAARRDDEGGGSASQARRPTRWLVWASAAALLVLAANFRPSPPEDAGELAKAGATAATSDDGGPTAGKAASEGNAAMPANAANRVATVTVLDNIAWSTDAAGPQLLSRVSVGQQVEFSSGTMELIFDTGAHVRVFGPAEFEISSAMSMNCSLGRVVTFVGESGKGFTIDTPQARIVDLGTQFGVDVSKMGDTQVVVFQGSIDLMRNAKVEAADAGASVNPSWTRRLGQGDAMVLGETGDAQRLVAVQRENFFPSLARSFGVRRTPTIVDVRDNIRAGESTKCYQIVHGGLRDDAPCYVDRAHQWNGLDEFGLPEFLVGADYIMPFNNDKFIADLKVEVEIARAATCYIFLDANMSPPPWLLESFRDTGRLIALDGAKTVWHPNNQTGVGPGNSVDFVFSVWQRDVDGPGTVTLGAVTPPKHETRPRGFNMYGIAVVPK